MKILLLASQSEDTITHKDGSIVKQTGGPFKFISNYLTLHDVVFDSAPNTSAIVNVFVDDNDEHGDIVRAETISVPADLNSYDSVIISTVSPFAFDFKTVAGFKGNLFIDLQGFLRAEKAKLPEIIKNLLLIQNFCIIKSTIRERALFNNVNGDLLKHTQFMVETDNIRGVNLLQENIVRHFNVPRVIQGRDTIGAGDTFFAACIYHFMTGKPINKAVTTAMADVCDFLTKML